MRGVSARGRWAAYALALTVTALAMWGIGGAEEGVVAAVPAKNGTRPATSPRQESANGAVDAPPALDLTRLGPRASNASRTDLFAAVDWERKVQEEEVRRNPPRPVPPPPPQAPPLPFRYLGKMMEDGRTTAFIVSGERNLIVREGDTVQDAYRVERIDDQAMTFTYLPLKQSQVLSFTAVPTPVAAAASGQRPPEDD